MSQWTPGRTGPKAWWYRTARLRFLASFPVCWSCGHGGADVIDHYFPASTHPQYAYEPWNWRPSHGNTGCPVCGVKCNRVRSTTPGPPVGSPRSRRW